MICYRVVKALCVKYGLCLVEGGCLHLTKLLSVRSEDLRRGYMSEDSHI